MTDLPSDAGVEFRVLARFPGVAFGGDGSVWSVGKGGNWVKRRLSMTDDGYKRISITVRGKSKTYKSHRLTLEAFVGPCPSGMEACHRNGIRADNRISNLRWDTQRANAADSPVPSSHKLSCDDVRAIRVLYARGHVSYGQLGRWFGVDRSSVFGIVKFHYYKDVPSE